MDAKRREELLREIEAKIDLWPENVTAPKEWKVLIREALAELRETKKENAGLSRMNDVLTLRVNDLLQNQTLVIDLKDCALGLISWVDLLR